MLNVNNHSKLIKAFNLTVFSDLLQSDPTPQQLRNMHNVPLR